MISTIYIKVDLIYASNIYVADSALYSADNLQQLGQLRWITLVPASLKAVNILILVLFPHSIPI